MDKQPQSTSHFMTKTTEINPTPTAVSGTTTTCAKGQMWESIPRNNSPPPACKQYRACLFSHDTWDPAQHTQAQLHFPKSALRSKYSSQKLHDRRTTDLKRKILSWVFTDLSALTLNLNLFFLPQVDPHVQASAPDAVWPSLSASIFSKLCWTLLDTQPHPA